MLAGRERGKMEFPASSQIEPSPQIQVKPQPRVRRRRRKKRRASEPQSPGVTEYEKKSVMISSFLFSALAVQNLNLVGVNEAEGFLLGEITSELNRSFTDFPLSGIQVVHTINLQRYIACNPLLSFHSSSGEVNVQALKKTIPLHEKNVIGWYKFRRNSIQKVTYREKVLHKNLQQHLSNSGLVFMTLTSNATTGNGSTHILDYELHGFQNGLFHKIPLVVTNLGTSEYEGYKTEPGACTSPAFGQVSHMHGSEFFNADGTVKEACRTYDFCLSVQTELKEVCNETAHSEQLVKNLIDEINKLKKEIAVKRVDDESAEMSDGSKAKELCQALHEFFPKGEYVHSCSACAKGKRTARRGYDSKSKLKSVTELTLLVENPKFPEAEEARATIRQQFFESENPLAMEAEALRQRDEEKTDEAIMQESLATENPPLPAQAEAPRGKKHLMKTH